MLVKGVKGTPESVSAKLAGVYEATKTQPLENHVHGFMYCICLQNNIYSLLLQSESIALYMPMVYMVKHCEVASFDKPWYSDSSSADGWFLWSL